MIVVWESVSAMEWTWLRQWAEPCRGNSIWPCRQSRCRTFRCCSIFDSLAGNVAFLERSVLSLSLGLRVSFRGIFLANAPVRGGHFSRNVHESNDNTHKAQNRTAKDEMRSVHDPPVSPTSVLSMCHRTLTRQDYLGKGKLSLNRFRSLRCPPSHHPSSNSTFTFNSSLFPASSLAGR